MKISFILWLKELSIALISVFVLTIVYIALVGANGGGVVGHALEVFLAPFVTAQDMLGIYNSSGGTGQELILPAYTLFIFLLSLFFLRVSRSIARMVMWAVWILAWSAVCIILRGMQVV
jgi:hypothetical protein